MHPVPPLEGSTCPTMQMAPPPPARLLWTEAEIWTLNLPPFGWTVQSSVTAPPCDDPLSTRVGFVSESAFVWSWLPILRIGVDEPKLQLPPPVL